MNINFSGMVVLVAGGTGGLGRAVSLAFLKEGAKVVVTYRNQKEFAGLQSAAAEGTASLEGFSVDVTDETAVEGLVQGILSRHGRLDALVNTVGGFAGGVKLWEMDSQTLERMLTLNLRASYVLSRSSVRPMLRQKQGSIVNVASKAAWDHAAGASAYAASKAAAVALIDSLAADVKGSGVRVNSILPSIIDTEVNRKAMPDADFSTWPKPEDIAQVVLFLSSDHARVIHGAAIPVFGNS